MIFYTEGFRIVDPLASSFPSYTPYHYVHGNPVNLIDPTGMSAESTHTDKDGNIIAVYDDGDTGVYRHDNIEASTHIDGKISAVESSRSMGDLTGGGTRMGSTANWDKFVSPESGTAMTGVQIEFGESWNPTIETMSGQATADGLSLRQVANASGPGGRFDIKANPAFANKGRLLDGQYATTRSAGNYMAGRNAANSSQFGVGISFETFQKLAGRLHAQTGRVTPGQKLRTVLWGETARGTTSPTWGEIPYQQRMSRAGWDSAGQ